MRLGLVSKHWYRRALICVVILLWRRKLQGERADPETGHNRCLLLAAFDPSLDFFALLTQFQVGLLETSAAARESYAEGAARLARVGLLAQVRVGEGVRGVLLRQLVHLLVFANGV